MPRRPTDAHQRAILLDGRITGQAASITIPEPSLAFRQVRKYLQDRVDAGDTTCGDNLPHALVRFIGAAEGHALILLGPEIDKGPDPSQFRFSSRARLSFGIALKEVHLVWRLSTYRFHLQLPPGRPWEAYRFEFREQQHPEPLREPQCHVHPGLPNLRLPSPVMTPLEILDHIFFVIEPRFA